MLLDLGEPAIDADETLLIRQVTHHDDAVSTLVIRVGDSPIPFLSGRVPDLELNRGLVDLKSSESLQGKVLPI